MIHLKTKDQVESFVLNIKYVFFYALASLGKRNEDYEGENAEEERGSF